MMSWSCPFHSFQLPLHVPVIFSVCPLHFPCMSRSIVASHFPTSPAPLVFVSVPFMSLSVPLCFPLISRCFPVMSASYFLPSFPCTSLHFPSAPQYFPQKKSTVFPKRTSKNTVVFQFGKRRQETKPAKSRQGDSSLGPLSEDYVQWNVIKLPRTPPKKKIQRI